MDQIWIALMAIGTGFASQILLAINGRKKASVSVDELKASIQANHNEIQTKLKEQDKKIAEIKAELSPNGGSTTKDQVMKLIAAVHDLKSSQAAYMAIVLNRDDEALFIADANGQWIFVNEELADMFGINYRDATGSGWLEAIGTSNRERIEMIQAWEDFRTKKIPFKHNFVLVNQSTGEKSECLATAKEFRGQDGSLLFYLGKVAKAA